MATGFKTVGKFSTQAFGREADMLRKLKQAYYQANNPRKSVSNMTKVHEPVGASEQQ